MKGFGGTLLFCAIGLVLATVLELWQLRWWQVDVVLGVLFFIVAWVRRDLPATAETGLKILVSAIVLFVLSLLFSRALGLTLEGWNSTRFPWRALRYLPSFSISLLTYGGLAVLRNMLSGR